MKSLLFSFTLICIFLFVSGDCEFQVSPEGNDTSCITDPGAPCATIRTALNLALGKSSSECSGVAHLILQSGIYNGNTSRNNAINASNDNSRTLRIASTQNGNVTIDAENQGYHFLISIANIQIVGVRFINAASSSIIFTASSLNVSVDNCTFSNNYAVNGGAIVWSGSGYGRITNTTFSANNASQNGGGVFVNGSGVLYVEGSQFNNNLATKNGGALSAVNTTLVISKSSFKFNMASNGGAISTSKVTTCGIGTWDSLTFTNNTAVEDGGAINDYSSSLCVQNSFFSGQFAEDGGALYLINSNSSFSNLVVNSNLVEETGGGAYVEMTTTSDSIVTVIENSLFESNEARNGGGVYCNSAIASLGVNNFTTNRAIESGNNTDCSSTCLDTYQACGCGLNNCGGTTKTPTFSPPNVPTVPAPNAPSQTASPTATPTAHKNNGLSTGSKVAIGIIVPLVIIVVGLVVYSYWRKRIPYERL
eukprot:TRINITY_DN6660_c0_g3_i2.p1 TRINITY_DN6660_c0_g3~~TRINITY_DN6660_c0_g3_i2.p1  ORF type:complete len:478 (-),score=83.03 TRINITY_DN6660_c0_g3_i2:88-1521(-)